MKKSPLQKPSWLKQRIRNDETYKDVHRLVKGLQLHTVCESADCPNIGECFGNKTATFLILGGTCTRACKYCAVPKGRPDVLDPQEGKHVAEAAAHLGLRHVVITSVTRDDLPHGGAEQFADVVHCLKQACPKTTTEVLTPDFKGDLDALKIVMNSHPTVFNHNIETVRRFFPKIRPIADYDQSLKILRAAADYTPHSIIKSGIMVGFGETAEDLLETLHDLYNAGVTVVTIGQYLQPSVHHVPVAEYVTPETFEKYRQTALEIGFSHVVSGPLVRSSYHAGLAVNHIISPA